MDEAICDPQKHDQPESDSEEGNKSSVPEKNERGKLWTKREMEDAEPYPLPEVPEAPDKEADSEDTE